MEAGKRNITDIFNRARMLQIPFFQRAYVWSEDNWERFLEDMVETTTKRRPYFLGSVIQKQRPTTSDAPLGDIRAVIDGQQRLTTLCLFFKTLFAARDEDARFRDVFRTLNGDLILQHNHADIEVFEAALEGRLTPELRERHTGSQILKAHDYFEQHQSKLRSIDPMTLIQLVYFVGIDLGSEEDEQQIFDTINSLGVALTTAELLKNELFGRRDLDLYNVTWKAVFERDASARGYWGMLVTAGRSRREMVDLFLQSYLILQEGVGDDLRVERLFDEYKHHLKERVSDRERFIRDLAESARLFRDHVRVEVLDEELNPDNGMDRLNVVLFGLNTTTVFPYVLYVLKTVPDQVERNKIFRLLESYLIRRLVCRETTKNYNKMFSGFIRAGLNTYDGLVARLLGATDSGIRMPTDEMVVQAFQESNLTNAQARLLLYVLERSIRDDFRQSTALSGLTHYSLEHLMPKKWRNHWGSLPDEESRQRDDALRKLGNLSLLSSTLNTSIRDSAWDDKKRGKGKHNGLNKYASGLETLADDLSLDDWNEETIQKRGLRLAQQALTVWPFPQY